MFVINNELLNKQNLPEHWAWYQKKIKALKDKKRFWTFSAFKIVRFETDENGRKIRMKRFKMVPTQSTYDNKDMGEVQTWLYAPSASAIRNENGISKVLNPKPFMISESTIYDIEKDSDREIVFFLMYISEALKNKRIYLVDHEEENIKKVNDAAVAAEAQYLIFSPQSHINEELLGTDEVFRQLGIAYGISRSTDMHLAELKNSLWNYLVTANNKTPNNDIFGGFIKDCYNSTDAEYKSTILLAVERDIVYFDKGGWWIRIRGEYDELIVRVPTNETSKRKEVLIGYLMQHREYMAIVREALENSAKRMGPIESSIPGKEVNIMPTKQIKDMKRNDMMHYLTERGWKFQALMKFKNPELIEMIRKDRRPERVTT